MFQKAGRAVSRLISTSMGLQAMRQDRSIGLQADMRISWQKPLMRWRKALVRQAEGLWPSLPLAALAETLVETRRMRAEIGDPTALPAPASDWLRAWQQEPDTAFIRRIIRPCTIDPLSKQIFVDGKTLWGSSDVPALERGALFRKHRTKPDLMLDRAINLHYAHAENYFHFFNDVLSKLCLVERHAHDLGLGFDTPVIIGAKLARQPFFTQAQAMGVFGSHPVVVQGERQIIGVRELFLVKAHDCDFDGFEWARNRLITTPKPAAGAHLYLTRGKAAANARRFRNIEAVSALMERHAISWFDPQEHDLATQIATLAQASLIIAPHGAGLTNLMFRQGNPTDVIEIVNETHSTPHFYMMCLQRGFSHRWTRAHGDQGKENIASSLVDIDALERLIQHILASR
jgi:capsular polysaccharide biosynthesis protein